MNITALEAKEESQMWLQPLEPGTVHTPISLSQGAFHNIRIDFSCSHVLGIQNWKDIQKHE